MDAYPYRKVFQRRREHFLSLLDSDGIVILPGRSTVMRNLDIPYPFRQDSHFYYLTGIEAPGAIAVLDPSSRRYRFVLYYPRKDRKAAIYEGKTPDANSLKAMYGADLVLPASRFATTIMRFVKRDRPIYYPFGVNPEVDRIVERLFLQRRSGGLWPVLDPLPFIARMRLIKDSDDFALGLQRALEITIAAHRHAMARVRPGMKEYELLAEFIYVFRKSGSLREAYPCIIASGPNSCILHYSSYTRQMQDGELVLMDCGAEYGYYAADVTRTVPVNGRFNPQQSQLYQVVLHAQEAALQYIAPGVQRKQVEDRIRQHIADALREWGWIRDEKHAKWFMLHNCIHWLGMDVHDVGGYLERGKPMAFQPGMVMTVEPGLYIRPEVLDQMSRAGYSSRDIREIRKRMEPFFHIGIRIEDDVLVTETGCQVLTRDVPKTIEEIEDWMKTNRGNYG